MTEPITEKRGASEKVASDSIRAVRDVARSAGCGTADAASDRS